MLRDGDISFFQMGNLLNLLTLPRGWIFILNLEGRLDLGKAIMNNELKKENGKENFQRERSWTKKPALAVDFVQRLAQRSLK